VEVVVALVFRVFYIADSWLLAVENVLR